MLCTHEVLPKRRGLAWDWSHWRMLGWSIHGQITTDPFTWFGTKPAPPPLCKHSPILTGPSKVLCSLFRRLRSQLYKGKDEKLCFIWQPVAHSSDNRTKDNMMCSASRCLCSKGRYGPQCIDPLPLCPVSSFLSWLFGPLRSGGRWNETPGT